MKKVLMMLCVGLLFQGFASAETYIVDTDASSVGWYATKVAGSHNGSVALSSGKVEFDGDTFIGGEAVMNMNSITVEDIKKPSTNKDLVDHLKNEDFFDVTKHPEAMIKITDVAAVQGNMYEVTADITIKDITRSISFPAEVVKSGDGVKATAEITIDRTQFNVRYGSGKFFENLGNRMIHDDFDLSVSIEANQ